MSRMRFYVPRRARANQCPVAAVKESEIDVVCVVSINVHFLLMYICSILLWFLNMGSTKLVWWKIGREANLVGEPVELSTSVGQKRSSRRRPKRTSRPLNATSTSGVSVTRPSYFRSQLEKSEHIQSASKYLLPSEGQCFCLASARELFRDEHFRSHCPEPRAYNSRSHATPKSRGQPGEG